jgi:NADPH:quinone reductase-like Zn-dependent oxidoreductase
MSRAAELTFAATDTVNAGDPDWVEQVMNMTDGLGVDVAIEAVGIPATFTACTKIVRPGGSVAYTANPSSWRCMISGSMTSRSLPGCQHEYHADAAQARLPRASCRPSGSEPTSSSWMR